MGELARKAKAMLMSGVELNRGPCRRTRHTA